MGSQQPKQPNVTINGVTLTPEQLASSDYDYIGALKAGVTPGVDPHETEIDPKTGKPYLHWDSKFKKDHHWHRFLPSEMGIYDSKNNRIVPQAEFNRVATDDQRKTVQTEKPLPRAEVQGYLKNAEDELPPISQQAERTKAANPSEARPKFGPGSTKAAAATVPPEIQSALTHQDKVALANAMHKFGRGDIDDRQLELEVAKVLMRVGGKKLEGPALNKAVAAWTEVLRRGAKSKKEFVHGQ